MRKLPDTAGQLAALESIADSTIWQDAIELTRSRRYRQVAAVLDELRLTSKPDMASAEVFLAAQQICLACDRFLEEARLMKNFIELAAQQEHDLQEHLIIILQQLLQSGDPSPGSRPAIPIIELSAPSDATPTEKTSGLWQRVQRLLSGRESRALDALAAHNTLSGITDVRPLDSEAERTALQGEGLTQALLSPPSLIVFCLGRFRFYAADRNIAEWPNRKSKSLLKYLLLHHDHPVRRDVLMETFWPDHDPNAARNNLNVAIYTLRQTLRALSPDLSYVMYYDESYFLNPELGVWIDLEEFQQRISAGRKAFRRGDVLEAVNEYGTAVELYQGDLLEEDLYEPWVTPLRQELHQAYIGALSFLSAYYYEHGQDATCIGYCRLLLAVERAEESIHRRLMRAYARHNQRYLAIRQYQQCVEALREELDVDPDPQTVRLYEAILHNRPV